MLISKYFLFYIFKYISICLYFMFYYVFFKLFILSLVTHKLQNCTYVALVNVYIPFGKIIGTITFVIDHQVVSISFFTFRHSLCRGKYLYNLGSGGTFIFELHQCFY